MMATGLFNACLLEIIQSGRRLFSGSNWSDFRNQIVPYFNAYDIVLIESSIIVSVASFITALINLIAEQPRKESEKSEEQVEEGEEVEDQEA